MRHRTPIAIALAAIVALAPLFVAPAFAASSPAHAAPAAATSGDPAPTGPKVVIVVGATEGTTASYRADADTIAAEALKYTSNVIKLYSPNAKWAQVKAAAQGASIFVYLGHGYGYPSPYRAVLSPDVQDGLGLNTPTGTTDNDKKYYGEQLIASDIRFARDAIVLLNHLCYSAGSSESGDPEPTVGVARERVDNFASGFIRAGARTVIAQSWTSGVIYAIRSIFTTDKSMLDVWEAAPNKQGHVQPFVPVRNPAFEARLDPDTATTGYHRSIVSATGHTTTSIRDGAAAAPTSATATPPEIWSVDGSTALTRNFDGLNDRLNLLARFSETVTWTAKVRNAGGDTVRTQTGSGHQAAVSWNATLDGDPAPDGDYTVTLTGTDGAGGSVDTTVPVTVTHPATPSTGVLTFEPTTPLQTTVGTIRYSLVFAGPIAGLTKSDFTRTGNAPKCVLGTPALAGAMTGAEYTLTFTGCTSGTVGLYLNAGQIRDAAFAVGPAGPAIAATVIVDSSPPKVATARPTLRPALALASPSTTEKLPTKLTWVGTDLGGGIASYDVQRSLDGGTFKTIISGRTAAYIYTAMVPGHSYRYRVRARDGSGNVGPWSPSYTWYPGLTQQSKSGLSWTGAWISAGDAQNSGGSAKRTVAAGASVSYTFSGRAIAWVTTLRPDAGAVQVWLDGVLKATVDTRADATIYRQAVYSKTYSSYGTHTIKLVSVGTADRPLVTVDAFEVVR
ncbi:MAG TPA: FlgD immunoglobulin-like domain containing protein [Candidatus Limnocylindrales bacterium]|nr:FlgD immunoglobulin-like domain containing protein [Candidatus Limnocylindrales bacterium]